MKIMQSCSKGVVIAASTVMYGTGFMVSKNMIGGVITSVLGIKGKFSYYSIINVYAPTEKSDYSVKDEFYD